MMSIRMLLIQFGFRSAPVSLAGDDAAFCKPIIFGRPSACRK
jgi:hypothetical protein